MPPAALAASGSGSGKPTDKVSYKSSEVVANKQNVLTQPQHVLVVVTTRTLGVFIVMR